MISFLENFLKQFRVLIFIKNINPTFISVWDSWVYKKNVFIISLFEALTFNFISLFADISFFFYLIN
jgi:hypothetical protein